jgi:hypothetical protein
MRDSKENKEKPSLDGPWHTLPSIQEAEAERYFKIKRSLCS